MELIIVVAAAVLSSSVLTAAVTSWLSRRKTRAETANLETTKAEKLVNMAITQMHEERTFFELRIDLLEKRNDFLERRVSYLEQELAKTRGG